MSLRKYLARIKRETLQKNHTVFMSKHMNELKLIS
jgi:hypothetical protein